MRRPSAAQLGLMLAAAAAVAAVLSIGALGASEKGTGDRAGDATPAGQRLDARTKSAILITAPNARARASLAGKVKFRARVVTRRTVSRVEFRVDKKLLWTDRTAPFQFRGPKGRWNTASVKVGKHKLTVVAYDRRGKRLAASTSVVRVVRRAARPGTGPRRAPTSSPTPSGFPVPSRYAPPLIDGPASVFVSTTGSDSASCSAASPCRSFGRAYRAAQPGQIVEVAGGTYPEQTIPKDASKASGPYVIIRPKAGDTVRIARQDSGADDILVNGDFVEIRNMTVSDDFYVYDGSNSVVMRNITGRRFFITSASNVFVVGGSFGPVHNEFSSIKPRSSTAPRPRNIVIDGAYFHDYTRDEGAHVECLQAWSISGFTLRNSVFTRCSVFDVSVGELFQAVTDDALIENNWFDDTIEGNQALRVAATNSTIRYNSVVGTLYVDPGYSSNVKVIANVAGQGGCGAGVSYEYNVWTSQKCSATDVRAASGFVRGTRGNIDLHLTPSSPAIGRGKPGAFPPSDIDGQDRPQGAAPDAGADER